MCTRVAFSALSHGVYSHESCPSLPSPFPLQPGMMPGVACARTLSRCLIGVMLSACRSSARSIPLQLPGSLAVALHFGEQMQRGTIACSLGKGKRCGSSMTIILPSPLHLMMPWLSLPMHTFSGASELRSQTCAMSDNSSCTNQCMQPYVAMQLRGGTKVRTHRGAGAICSAFAS